MKRSATGRTCRLLVDSRAAIDFRLSDWDSMRVVVPGATGCSKRRSLTLQKDDELKVLIQNFPYLANCLALHPECLSKIKNIG